MLRYYVDSNAAWFVVEASSKRVARSVGSQEFGRGQVRCVRRATDVEVEYFIGLKGKSALRAD